MNFDALKRVFTDNGCTKLYVKVLSPNDNSKNQVYLGGSFEVLNIFPISSIKTEPAGDWKKERFKANLTFGWITSAGTVSPAPHSQLILYPKYPEVRFSGFLAGCENPPSDLMTQRLPGRILFLGVTPQNHVLGYVADPGSPISVGFLKVLPDDTQGVFSVIILSGASNPRNSLLTELRRIHNLGWITSNRLDSTGKKLPCRAPNCGGYTLEAELGIKPNGNAEPDFLGWEIKQFGVSNFTRLNAATITLMTPEPDGGVYKAKGVEAFIRKHGYTDKKGRPNRTNFGGVHRADETHKITNLTLTIDGFDLKSGKIRKADGNIALIDINGDAAASWSFASIILHWNKKHNQACYVPSIVQKDSTYRYKYGNKVMLGIGTGFELFLQEMADGRIYYDPGIKLEKSPLGKLTTKRRSQFRIKSSNLQHLYRDWELVDL